MRRLSSTVVVNAFIQTLHISSSSIYLAELTPVTELVLEFISPRTPDRSQPIKYSFMCNISKGEQIQNLQVSPLKFHYD